MDTLGDPDVELLQHNYSPGTRHNFATPAAAWVLLSIFLLNYIQSTYSDNVINEISQLVTLKTAENKKRNKPFSKRLMIFCLTLAGYSSKAYSYLRTVTKSSIPCRETLRKYRNRVDGSPGISCAALKMITNKVAEMHEKSKKLFLSLACDDMSIRYIFFTDNNLFSMIEVTFKHYC